MKMKVLVSNDDGYQSEGLNCLVDQLRLAGFEVIVFAPSDEQSGQGMAITLRESVRIECINKSLYVVHGTPVDSVNLAQTSGLIDGIDVLVSGINNGRNLGDDTLYSGTVAAALEARHLPLPSIACSMVSSQPKHYDTGAKLVVRLLEQIKDWPRASVDVLNLNVPDIPLSTIQGFEVTQLSTRKLSLPPKVKKISEHVSEYMIGAVGAFDVDKSQSQLRYDYQAVDSGYASVTPLKAQLQQTTLDRDCIEKLSL